MTDPKRMTDDDIVMRLRGAADQYGCPPDPLDVAAAERIQELSAALLTANARVGEAEKERDDAEQLRHEENRKVCEWMDRALAAEQKLQTVRRDALNDALVALNNREPHANAWADAKRAVAALSPTEPTK